MKLRIMYTCDFCGLIHEDKTTVEACEKMHLTEIEIVGKTYRPGMKLPQEISIKNRNGEVVLYRLANP